MPDILPPPIAADRAAYIQDNNVSQNEDQQFFDLFTLIIGLLIGVTVGIFILGRYVGHTTQARWVMQDDYMQAQVAARLAPAGRATLPGETRTAAVAAQVADAGSPAPSLSGEAVYNSACVACHGSGIGGAPRLGDVAAWSSRIAQGEAVLSDRVLNGYTGAAGYMPPKGGRVDLSDAEILAAMNYLLDQSR